MIQFGTSISETAASSLKPSRPSCSGRFVGAAIAESLFGALDAIDREVDVEGKVYRVVGRNGESARRIVRGDRSKIESPGFPSRPSSATIPRSMTSRSTSRLSPINSANLWTKITELMRRRRGVANDKANDFGISTPGAFRSPRSVRRVASS